MVACAVRCGIWRFVLDLLLWKGRVMCFTVKSFCLGLMIAGLFFSIELPQAVGQNCSQPAGATRIDDNYQPSGAGNWWRIVNWSDTNNDNFVDTSDAFNFSDANGMMELPDPTVMKLTANGETWYYFTGSPGSELSNFPIYRTRDFSTFELHMLTFDPVNSYNSNQWVNNGKLHINGTWYVHMVAPHLFIDPTHTPGPNRHIFLGFTGVQQATNYTQDSSIFLVRMKQGEFLAWKNEPNKYGAVNLRRFADARSGFGWQQWYYYKQSNGPGGPYLYDGGLSAGHPVPASGRPASLRGPSCGQLEERWRGHGHRCIGAAFFMERDGFEYFDPQLSSNDPWKRVMFYVWKDANGDVPYSKWGFHIAAHPLLANNIQFNKNYETFPVAFNRNTNNTMWINGEELDNGSIGLDLTPPQYGLQEREWGGVAEAPSVLYLPETDRYYVFYSRNAYDAAAYQIVYRMTEPGQPLSSIAMTWGDPDVPEYILLRTNNAWRFRDANAGAAEAFMITDAQGVSHPYIITGFKLDRDYDVSHQGTNKRTLFFKELTVANISTGRLVQLRESHESIPVNSLTKAQAQKDMRVFRIPRCRE